MPRAATITASPSPFAEVLALLNRDLQEHERAAAELRGLVSRLTTYAANGAAPPQPSPPVKHAGGRPVLYPKDTQRARKAAAMRDRRARLKAAAAAAAAKPTAKPPKAKPRGNKATTAPSADRHGTPSIAGHPLHERREGDADRMEGLCRWRPVPRAGRAWRGHPVRASAACPRPET